MFLPTVQHYLINQLKNNSPNIPKSVCLLEKQSTHWSLHDGIIDFVWVKYLGHRYINLVQ